MPSLETKTLSEIYQWWLSKHIIVVGEKPPEGAFAQSEWYRKRSEAKYRVSRELTFDNQVDRIDRLFGLNDGDAISLYYFGNVDKGIVDGIQETEIVMHRKQFILEM